MQKVLIIGSCGAGKSTLARQIHDVTGLPLIHLDQEYWLPNWVEMEKAVWENKVNQLIARPAWVMDGNYGGTMERRMEVADTIIFLDFGRWTCLYRVLKRIFTNYGQVRADMPPGCRERLDWEFLHYVYRFQDRKRPDILRRIERFGEGKMVITINNDRALQALLRDLSIKGGV